MSEILVTTVKHESATTDNITLASTGDVGIGTSSPAAKLAVVGGTSNASNLATAYSLAAFNITPKSTSGYSLQFGSGPADLPYIQMSAGGAASGNMTIQPYGGSLLVGTTGLPTAGTLGTAFQVGASIAGMATWTQRSSSTAASDHAYFYNPNGIVGFIRTTNSSTAYSTSSDYRLKEDWQPITGASERVKALKPVNFAWKADGSRVDGFLAHEAAEVVPEAVSNEKDAMRDEEYEVTPAVEATYDEEGNELTPAVEAVMGTRSVPNYQGIDQSKLVPLLTAALQEALAKIDDLTARVSVLETA